MKKVFTWIGELSTAVKLITGVLVIIGTLAGWRIAYGNKIIQEYKDKQEIITKTEVKTMIDTVLDSLGGVSLQVRNLNPRLYEIERKVDVVTIQNKNQRDYQIQNAKTTEEIKELLRVWDVNEKKNLKISEYQTQ